MDNNEEMERVSNFKKYILWIVDKRMYIFSILACIVFINVIVFKIKPLIVKKSPIGIVLADQYYLNWKDSAFKDAEKLNKLKDLIKKNPSLKSNYEGLIVQNLMMYGNLGNDDCKIVDRLLERNKTELPLYYEYSKNALLINNEEYVEALKKSNELKMKMLSDLSFLDGKTIRPSNVLYTLNLLRIALLEGKLNNDAKEFLAWQELEDYLNLDASKNVSENMQIAAATLKETYHENGIELIDYIQYRKNKISPTKP